MYDISLKNEVNWTNKAMKNSIEVQIPSRVDGRCTLLLCGICVCMCVPVWVWGQCPPWRWSRTWQRHLTTPDLHRPQEEGGGASSSTCPPERERERSYTQYTNTHTYTHPHKHTYIHTHTHTLLPDRRVPGIVCSGNTAWCFPPAPCGCWTPWNQTINSELFFFF